MSNAVQRGERRHPAWSGFVEQQTLALTGGENSWFSGKRILVTGAGGFLGSALARQLARIDGTRLVLLDLSEHGLYRLEQRLRSRRNCISCELIVGSINDRQLLDDIFTTAAPEVVFHAAARKHVPLMETNALAAAETNVLGTLALVEAARRARTQSFVLVSTDKAVEPISVMGATKRIAEQIVLSARIQALAQGSTAAFTCLRLCNVLGSTGSVAPLFRRQIAAGRAVTVTDPQATRYFITPQNAVHHMLRAALTSSRTGLLIPQVGPARRIEELATHLLERMPVRASSIQYTGLRAADKLHERLFSHSERIIREPAPFLFEIETSFDDRTLSGDVATLADAIDIRDEHALLRAIKRLVPGYRAQGAHVAETVAGCA